MIQLAKTNPQSKIRLSKIDSHDTPKIHIYEGSIQIRGESYLPIPMQFYKHKYRQIIKVIKQQNTLLLTIKLSFIDKESFQCLFLLCTKLHQYALENSKTITIQWWYHEEQNDWNYELLGWEQQEIIQLIQKNKKIKIEEEYELHLLCIN